MSDYTVKILLTAKDQASPAIKNLAQELHNLSAASSSGANDASTGFKKTSEEIQALYNSATMAYGVLSSFGDKVAEFYRLGVASTDARRVMAALTGSITEANNALGLMRATTNGVITDIQLMQGANRFLATGVATTTEELVSVTNMAVKLGQAMGVDTAEAIDSFATMLTNRSIERLDSFGIASDKVRARVNELKKEGVQFQAAFNMAVLEEGTKTLERLGGAAISVGAPIDVVQAKLDNIGAKLAENFSTSVYSIGGMLLLLMGEYPGQQEAKTAALNERLSFNMGIFQPMRESLSAGLGMGNNENDYFRQMVIEGLYALARDPELINNSRALGSTIVEQMSNAGIWDSEKMVQTFTGTFLDGAYNGEGYIYNFASSMIAAYTGVSETARESAASAARLAGEQDRIAAGAQRIADENAKAAAARAEELRTLQLVHRETEAAFKLTQLKTDTMRSIGANIWAEVNAFSRNQEFVDSIKSYADAYSYFTNKLSAPQIDWIMPTYMTRQNANDMRVVAQTLSDNLDALKKANETALVPISEDDIASMQTMVDNANAIADAGERAADAYDRIKLSDLFGQTDGGILGQITDSVTKYMESIGKTDKEIQAMRDALDLASGRQTPGSQFYDQNVVPAIAGLKPADAVRVSQAYDGMMRQLALNDATPQQIAGAQASFYRTYMGGGGGSGQIVVNPGDTLSGLSQKYQLPIQTLMAITGTNNPRLLQPGTYNAGVGGVNMPMLNTFDAASFIMSYLNGGTTAAGADMMGSPGMVGFGAGMFANGGVPGSGTGMSLIDTLAEAADASQPLVDNTQQIADNVQKANDMLTTLASNVTVVKILLDVDAGIFKELLTRMGIDVTGTSVRDNGGRVAGQDSRMQRTRD